MALEFAENESTWDCRVGCLSCSETIEVSVFVVESRTSVVKQSLNELLVDFGWLPTALGGYCRRHAVRG
jgi:hypothetical protein